MEELGFGLKRPLSIMGVVGLFMCAIALLSHRAGTLPGLLIGIATSFFYYLLLHYQLKKSSTMAPAQVDAYLKKGAFSRFCLVLVGIALVFRDPGASVIAFLVGIMLPFRFVLFLNSLDLLRKEFSKTEHHGNNNHSTHVSHPLLHGSPYRWGH